MDDSANPNNTSTLSNPGDQAISNPEAISPTPQAVSDFSASQTAAPIDPNTLTPAQPSSPPQSPPQTLSTPPLSDASSWSTPSSPANESTNALNVNPTSPAFNFPNPSPTPQQNTLPEQPAPTSTLPSFNDVSNPTPPSSISEQPNASTITPLDSNPSLSQPQSAPNPFEQTSPISLDQTPPVTPTPTFAPGNELYPSNQSASFAFDTAVGANPPNPLAEETVPSAPPSLEQTEPAPTDLSQLTANAGATPSTDIYNPTVSAPETLVVPAEPNATNPTAVSAMPHKTLPLPAIIGAVIVILAVSGASGYFILGIGKNSPPSTPTSLPISKQAPLTNPPKQTPTSTPNVNQLIQNPSISTGSSSFGALNGSASPTPTPTKAATSAADLLKAKQASSSATH
ncbi:hypothetical protein HY025_00360 [Candidatus Daviesbacteria bacterium]|nr:hypothetical protein [Candidatus Daviesbacteria bacterium]